MFKKIFINLNRKCNLELLFLDLKEHAELQGLNAREAHSWAIFEIKTARKNGLIDRNFLKKA